MQTKPSSFPGGQRTAILTKETLQSEINSGYSVTWRSKGRRGLLLVLTDGVFFIEPPLPEEDASSSSSQPSVSLIANMFFPRPKQLTHPQHRTLLDGILVMDREHHPTIRTPRYLAFDIFCHEGGNLMSKPLRTRAKYLLDGVINIRKHPKIKHDYSKEGVKIRFKEHFDLKKVGDLLKDGFVKNVTHEVDGVVFAPPNHLTSVGVGEKTNRILVWKNGCGVSKEEIMERCAML
mmetsp:Transcript_2624/g.4034  ORF Transcript_2624/g.4034 Transcript_2624/m.4034 type:complete len:234 (+) Transcript_2624:3-704(+)